MFIVDGKQQKKNEEKQNQIKESCDGTMFTTRWSCAFSYLECQNKNNTKEKKKKIENDEKRNVST